MNDDMPDVLARICQDTLREVEHRKTEASLDVLEQRARSAPACRGFGAALKQAAIKGQFALIAEVKKASPSGGLLCPQFDPAQIARDYAQAGAACLSVLTDAPYFQGSPDDLKTVRAAVELPVLRKDFILDPWQVYESRVMGADCILLIMAALTDRQAMALAEAARSIDLDVLVEVHDRQELDRALGLPTNLLGVNNRNLKTLRTDIATTVELAPYVPPDRFLIAESGIRSHDDVLLLSRSGVHSFLVGESLLRQQDLPGAVRTLLGRTGAVP